MSNGATNTSSQYLQIRSLSRAVRNLLSRWAFRKSLIKDAKECFRRMQQPQQHRFETHSLRSQKASSTPRRRQAFPMEPNPYIAQDQRQGDEEELHRRIARTRLDARLVQLPITRFDAEATSIGIFYPFCRTRLEAPVGVNPSVAAAPFPFAPVVAAVHADRHGRLGFAGPQRVLVPTTYFPLLKRADARERLSLFRLASTPDRRHQERHPRLLQIANHVDRVKPAIEQQKTRPNARLAYQRQQPLHDRFHLLAILDRRQCDRETLAVKHHVGAG